MKIKLLTLLLFGFTLILSSCSDDDDDEKLSNEFTLGGEDYDFTEGFYNITQEEIGAETFYAWNIYLEGDDEEQYHKFSFYLYTPDGESPNGTYTYDQNGWENDTFRSSFHSSVPEEHEFETNSAKSGTIKITKSDGVFNITFDIVYLLGDEEVRVKGAMKGEFSPAIA